MSRLLGSGSFQAGAFPSANSVVSGGSSSDSSFSGTFDSTGIKNITIADGNNMKVKSTELTSAPTEAFSINAYITSNTNLRVEYLGNDPDTKTFTVTLAPAADFSAA